ncbi:MAG TPA: MFS transporter [Rhizomicrobium sp.]|nr:MFS transporter [Rhizomicrobium sp.]
MQARAAQAGIAAHGAQALPLRIAALCALTQIFDGYDNHAIGLAAPAIARAWSLTPAALSNTFVLSGLGILIGSIIAGPLGDRLGRKPLIIAGLALAGTASLASAWAGSLAMLALARLVTGFGIGATLPTTVALLSDCAPQKSRANIVMFMYAGNTLGGFLGGQVAGLLLPHWGWPSLFVVGGLGPLALIPVLIALLPGASRLPGDAPVAATGAWHPITRELAGRTFRLWTIFFANMLSMALLTYWLPSILNLMGLAPSQSAFAASAASAGGLAATLPLAWFSSRYGSAVTLAVSLAAGGIFIALISLAGLSGPLLLAAIFGAGGCTFGCQLAANGVAATAYPARIRATGVGWALGIGRIGAFAGPALAGILTAMDWSPRIAILAGSIAALIAAVAATGLRRATAEESA